MKIIVALLSLAALAACSGGQVLKEEPASSKPVAASAAEPAGEVSPERQAYVDCYRELACRANIDYDPMDDYATIHEPVSQLRTMLADKDTRIKYYLPILERHGYTSAEAYLEKDQFFKEAVPVWWEKQRAGLLELMSTCKKP
ncbi:MAG: hypothetical protein FJ098_06000 [Deltaproteobacteria bacterium]|nr:hypothetical protein [Deltaproteobacteria bacterium]